MSHKNKSTQPDFSDRTQNSAENSVQPDFRDDDVKHGTSDDGMSKHKKK